MNISNNVLREHLKNVYFISGTACGGKTTIAKLLAEKYNFYLYDQDMQYSSHRSIANEKYQPAMCYPRNTKADFQRFFMRPVEEYTEWMRDSLHESAEMVLIDLIKLSAGQTVVADILFEPQDLQEIADKGHVVFLTADTSLIRETYFNRPDKRDFFEYVKTLDRATECFENIFCALEVGNRNTLQSVEDSGFYSIMRTKNSTIFDTLSKVEKHFNLTR